jgi:TRAP-type C4-dicarboxylate transport system substrate-binding protein
MRLSEFITACSAAVLLAAPIAADAQQKTAPQFTFRTAHYFKEDHPWHKGLAFFAKKVNDDSNGRIQVDIFSGGILGSEAQTMQLVKDGSLDFVVSDPSAGAPFARGGTPRCRPGS